MAEPESVNIDSTNPPPWWNWILVRDAGLYSQIGFILAGGVVFLAPILTPVVDHGGSTLFMVLAAYSLGVLVSLPSRWHSLEPAERVVLVGLLALFLAPLLSLVNADDLDSFLKTYERYARFLLLIPVYLLVRGFRRDLWPFLITGCLFAGPVLAIGAWYDVEILKLPRAQGPYHPIVFGDIAVLVALMQIVWIVTATRSAWHASLLISLPATLYAVILSGTRGAWLTLVLCLPIVAYAFARDRGKRFSPTTALIVLLLSVALIFMAWPSLKQKYEQTLTNFRLWTEGTLEKNSIGNRIELWELAIQVWQDHPLVGSGAGDFKSHVKRAREDEGTGFILEFDHAHSIYFHYLATTGTIVFIVMLFGLIVFPCRFFLASIGPPGLEGSPQAWAGVVLISAFALFGLTETWTVRSPLMSLFAIFLPTLMASSVARRPSGE